MERIDLTREEQLIRMDGYKDGILEGYAKGKIDSNKQIFKNRMKGAIIGSVVTIGAIGIVVDYLESERFERTKNWAKNKKDVATEKIKVFLRKD